MAETGRPSKFTEEARAILFERVLQGNFLAVAARCAGISYTTFKGWMARGRSEAPEDAEYRAFRAAVLRHRAAAEKKAVAKIFGSRQWKAAAWYLERSHPRRWGRVTKVKSEVSGPGGRPIRLEHQLDLSGLSEAELDALARIAEKVAPGPGGAPPGGPG